MSQDLEKLIQNIPGVVFQFRMSPDGTRSFPYLSVGVRDLYECSPEEAYADASLMTECVLEDDQEPLWRAVNQTMQELTPWVGEYRIRTPSGKIKWIRGQAQPEHQDDGSVQWSGIFVDISEIKATEARLLRLRGLYSAVIEANHLISHAQHQDELFNGICKIAVELGGMKMAWIGMPNARTQRLSPIAKYGAGIEILEDDSFFARLDAIEKRGQAATAFSENRTLINQDFLSNARTQQWQDLGRNYGFGSSASFPILDNQTPIAAFTVYRTEINGFDEESIALLERLSSDVSQAATAFSNTAKRKRLEEALRFRQFGLDHADEEILWIDKDARICEANETACRMLGYNHDELLRLTVPEIDLNLTPEKWPEHWQALRQSKILRFESHQKNRGGLTCPTEVVANHFEYQGVEYSCTLIRNITERKQMEEKIWNLAYFDPLTNLPNRRMLLDRLEQGLARAKRHQNSLAVIFLDLDNFKTINDSLGHDIGDLLLKEVAIRLTNCVRTEDTVSRLGGDEFVILLSEIALLEDAALVAEKILKAIKAPIEIKGNTLNISASIGIAVHQTNSSHDLHELLKQADAAMYAAKDAGRNGYRFHSE